MLFWASGLGLGEWELVYPMGAQVLEEGELRERVGSVRFRVLV